MMTSKLLMTAAVLGLGLAASAADAQSYQRPVVSHPYGTSHTLDLAGGGSYQAIAPDEYAYPAGQVTVNRRARGPVTAPLGQTVDPVPSYFYHAQGTMAVP